MSGSLGMTTSCLARIRNSWNRSNGDDSANQHNCLRLRDFRCRFSSPSNEALGMETSEPARPQRQNALLALVPHFWDLPWRFGNTACVRAIFLTRFETVLGVILAIRTRTLKNPCSHEYGAPPLTDRPIMSLLGRSTIISASIGRDYWWRSSPRNPSAQPTGIAFLTLTGSRQN